MGLARSLEKEAERKYNPGILEMLCLDRFL